MAVVEDQVDRLVQEVVPVNQAFGTASRATHREMSGSSICWKPGMSAVLTFRLASSSGATPDQPPQ